MDRISKKQRSELMSKIRSESNIEVLPDNLIGLYLRKHQRNILGNPDFSNKSRKIAVFIDGCFWHHCPIHGKFPKSNRKYWIPKLKENKRRDKRTTRKLLKSGWKVIRIWEHQLRIK